MNARVPWAHRQNDGSRTMDAPVPESFENRLRELRIDPGLSGESSESSIHRSVPTTSSCSILLRQMRSRTAVRDTFKLSALTRLGSERYAYLVHLL